MEGKSNKHVIEGTNGDIESVAYTMVISESKDMGKINDPNTFSLEDVQKTRDWFLSLSDNDRLLALSFQDEAFLDTLYRLSTHSCADSTTDRQVDWMADISTHFFESSQTIMKIDNGEINEHTEGDSGESSSPVTVLDRDDEPCDSKLNMHTDLPAGDEPLKLRASFTETLVTVTEKEDTKDSDDFRIGANGEAMNGTISQPFGGSKAVTCGDDDTVESTLPEVSNSTPETPEISAIFAGNRDIIQTFVNNVVVVFPSVCELLPVRPDFSGLEAVPAVSLQPSYISTNSGDKLLELLDELMTSGKFLSDVFSDDWNTGVTEMIVGGAQTQPMPFYMLLMLRLELAVIRSYMGSSTHARLNNEMAISFTGSSLVSDGDMLSVAQSIPYKTEPKFLVNLLPFVFEQLSSFGDSYREDAVYLLGALLNSSEKYTSLSTALRTMCDRSTQTVRHLVQQAVSDIPAEEADQSESPVGASTIIPPGPEATGEITGEIMEDSFSASATTYASASKSSRKKRKKKKRKGTVPVPVSPKMSETEQEPDPRDNAILDVAPIPNLAKVDGCTQTDDVSSSEIVVEPCLPIPALSTPETLENKVDNIWSSNSSHSSKSSVDEHDDRISNVDPQRDGSSLWEMSESRDESQFSSVDGDSTAMVSMSTIEGTMSTIEGTENGEESTAPETEVDIQEDDHDEWETVEVRSRGNRKKANDRNNTPNNVRPNALHNHNGNNKQKKSPRTSESRKRSQRRKTARDIVVSVLDTVHEQVMKKNQQQPKVQNPPSAPRPVPNAWGTIQTKKNISSTTVDKVASLQAGQSPAVGNREGATIRDVLMGKTNDPPQASQVAAPKGHTEQARQQESDVSKIGVNKAALSGADQNTAPTLTETLSAVSVVTDTRSVKNLRVASGAAAGESSSNESVDATKPQNNSNQSQETQASPPLPTLLSPGNSATSSVASSLEAPHAAHHNHLPYAGNEKDVGYHLLRVCDRLTRDIGNFMKRRAQALEVRRYERKLVLSALQDSLTTIWPGGCKVQTYGSCATDLDLPSSDMDVVVCGLDQSELAALASKPQGMSLSQSKSDLQAAEYQVNRSKAASEEMRSKSSPEKSMGSDGNSSQYPLSYKPMTTNAERVVTLAMELERQPWAVHVKAIPTATVPVIKILADPARLQGVNRASSEWFVQQPKSSSASASTESSDKMPYPNAKNLMPWRGADVTNGLLSVDITFEGPEHGGIGSTILSTHVMDEFSRETGLPADATAPVQVLMVLKELLAQRRLNEPFSGGLSSYALLLLVISVVRERGIIRKELELVERQRKLVAAGGGNAIPQDPAPPGAGNQRNGKSARDITRTRDHDSQGTERVATAKSNSVASLSVSAAVIQKNDKSKKLEKPENEIKGVNGNGMDGMRRVAPAVSSWASIAGKSLSTQASKSVIPAGTGSDIAVEQKHPTTKQSDAAANAVANTESTQKRTKIIDSTKVKAKGAEDIKQTSVGEQGRGKNKDIESILKEKGTGPKLPASASTLEPHTSSNKHGSAPITKANAATAVESGSFFPQSFHDVIEVLCSGETTSGKLLLHFLLFYGQHFDSHSTAIDYSDTHKRDPNANNGYAVASPYMQRRNTGFYDPMTGMYMVDPIVIYDPLVGAEANNVARSCFAWSSIRWVFAQSYMTLSSAIEMSAGHHPEKGHQATISPTQDAAGSGHGESISSPQEQQEAPWGMPYRHDESGNVIFDPKTPLLELLLSF